MTAARWMERGRTLLKCAAMVTSVLLAMGCNLLFFADVSGIRYHPAARNSLLQEDEQPWIDFDFAVDRRSVEQLFSIRFLDETVAGRFRWDGSRVSFVAEPPLIVGRRYLLQFDGAFLDRSGRDHRVATYVPFFFVTNGEPPPAVIGIFPSSGSDIAAHQSLEVRFSKPMVREGPSRDISLRPEAEYRIDWDAQGSTATIVPLHGWPHGAALTLSLGRELQDTLGIPLERQRQFTFQVFASTVRPEVVTLESIVADLESEPPLAGPGDDLLQPAYVLTGLSGIRVVFSTAMDQAATEGAFVLAPAVSGTFYWPRPETMVFVPAQAYQSQTEYVLSISDRASDRNGNRLLHEISVPLTVSVPPLSLERIEILPDDGVMLEEFSEFVAHRLTPGPPPHYPYTFIMRFSQPFRSDREKLALSDALTLSSLLPGSFSSPFPVGYSWIADTTLAITFHGLHPSHDDRRNYLLLEIRGGAAGIRTDGGSYMSADFRQLLVTGAEQ